MFSKIKIFGHPLHPILVAYPIAFYTATFAAFLTYYFLPDAFWFRVGLLSNIVGVGTAVIAALPGFIDWAMGIPRETRAKSVGLWHMLLNVAALGAFSANLILYWKGWQFPSPPTLHLILLPAIGLFLTSIAGYLGGHLIFKYHVGVQPFLDEERPGMTREIPEAERLRTRKVV